MKPYILLIGAFERDNFGDLLFPKILDKYLSAYSTFKGSLISRDLTSIGGDLVVPIKEFLRTQLNNPPLAIIHCGGETLTCSRESGVSMALPISISQFDDAVYARCENEIAEKVASFNNKLAYLYNHSDLNINNKIPIAFISVGGSSIINSRKNKKSLSLIRSKLKGAKFLSVRDLLTQKKLKKYANLESKLHPDLVHILSRTHRAEVKKAEKDIKVKKNISGKPYILFQANAATFEKFGINIFADKLSQIAEKFNMRLILQPAGLARGYGSIGLYKMLADLITQINPKVKVLVQEDRNLWKQVTFIANSACAIGTSLHLRIVASSFGRPYVSLPIDKVNNYAKSWNKDNQPYNIYPKYLVEAVNKAINTDPNLLRQVSNEMADRVEEGILGMLKKIALKPSADKNSVKKIDSPKNPELFLAFFHETERLREQLVKEILNRNALEMEVEKITSSRIWKILSKLREYLRKFRQFPKIIKISLTTLKITFTLGKVKIWLLRLLKLNQSLKMIVVISQDWLTQMNIP